MLRVTALSYFPSLLNVFRSEKWPLGSGFISLPSVAAFSGLLTWLTESLPPLQQQHSVSHNYIIIKFPKVWKILYLHCNTMIMIEQTLSFLINHSNHRLPVSTWSLQRTEQQHYVWLLFDYQFLTSSFQQCSGVWSTSPRCHGVGMTSPPSLSDLLTAPISWKQKYCSSNQTFY